MATHIKKNGWPPIFGKSCKFSCRNSHLWFPNNWRPSIGQQFSCSLQLGAKTHVASGWLKTIHPLLRPAVWFPSLDCELQLPSLQQRVIPPDGITLKPMPIFRIGGKHVMLNMYRKLMVQGYLTGYARSCPSNSTIAPREWPLANWIKSDPQRIEWSHAPRGKT